MYTLFSTKTYCGFVLSCIIILLFPAGHLYASSTIQVIDDSGSKVILNYPARKIISLSPHTTELLFAAGAGDKIVATVIGSNYPEAVRDIKKIGRAGKLDYESILALQPDLIVGWLSGNRKENISRLKKLGLKVFLSEPKKLEDIATNIKKLGILAGTEKKANKAVISYQNKLLKLKLKYNHKEPVKVFYLLWHKPILTISSEHIISDVIRLCGGVNVFGQQAVYTPTIDFESVLQKNPDVIITASMGNKKPDWLVRWQQWQGITAVKNNDFLWLNPDWIHRQGPRILLAADKMCRFLDEVRSKK